MAARNVRPGHYGHPMQVGVYVDGFNLYYGAKFIMGGPGVPGWRWLDLRLLSGNLVRQRSGWSRAEVTRVVYCTARIHPSATNPGAQRDQDTYLRALREHGSVDICEEGVYVNRVAVSPLAVKDAGGKPSLVAPSWPVMVQDSAGQNVASARFMVSVARREEKGSDVNVATHLLIDAFSSRIDAAVVITNDSDLALPIRHVRESAPVGLVNPTSRHCAGALSSSPREKALVTTGGTALPEKT
jgi:uncharacterized LabA/DUF88 family protein